MRYKKRKLTKKQRQQRRNITAGFILFLFIFTFGFLIGKNGVDQNKWAKAFEKIEMAIESIWKQTGEKNTGEASAATFQIFDVGQGSAALLQSDDGTNILIDTGRHDDKEKKILQYLDQNIGTGGKIDLLIFTHNHADHLGYGDKILSYYQVKEVWMNGQDATSKIYERVLDGVENSNAVYEEPRAGDKRHLGPFSIEVLSPKTIESDDQNENSISARIGINGLHIMTTGDAGTWTEKQILESGQNVRSDILLLGHHGSKYSTSNEWLSAVKPDLAIYSAGKDNIYGHPSDEAVKRVKKAGVSLYGTDSNGTVTILIEKNGKYQIHLEKGGKHDENGSGRN